MIFFQSWPRYSVEFTPFLLLFMTGFAGSMNRNMGPATAFKNSYFLPSSNCPSCVHPISLFWCNQWITADIVFPYLCFIGCCTKYHRSHKRRGIGYFSRWHFIKSCLPWSAGEVGGYQIKSYMVDYCHNCLFNFVSEVTMAESGFATVSSTHSYLECAYKSPSSPPFRGPPNTLSTD